MRYVIISSTEPHIFCDDFEHLYYYFCKYNSNNFFFITEDIYNELINSYYMNSISKAQETNKHITRSLKLKKHLDGNFGTAHINTKIPLNVFPHP